MILLSNFSVKVERRCLQHYIQMSGSLVTAVEITKYDSPNVLGKFVSGHFLELLSFLLFAVVVV